MITDRDMADQIKQIVDMSDEQVSMLVSLLQRDHGTMSIDDIPSGEFWEAVLDVYDRTESVVSDHWTAVQEGAI